LNVLLEAEGLKKYFPVKSGLVGRGKGWVHAVDDVTFDIRDGETLGLVGESGSGKTTVARLVLMLEKGTAGTVRFMGQDIFNVSDEEVKRLRRDMQMIFQDPFASLNPRKSVRQILSRPFILHEKHAEKSIEDRVVKLVETVGLTPPSLFLDRHPHEFSGGQRQRIGIARAIASRPKLIIADEPVSSLDMSVRAQILNLIKQLQKELNISYLFITHDLAVVRSLCHRVAVMYLGKIVEMSGAKDFYSNPMHPYAKALLSATLVPNPELRRKGEHLVLKGEIPSPINPPSGCRFRTRCPYGRPVCAEEEPLLEKCADDHFVACHFAGRL
jgi:oligopeptide/dipeptide ABC transporter ATP-binding protein